MGCTKNPPLPPSSAGVSLPQMPVPRTTPSPRSGSQSPKIILQSSPGQGSSPVQAAPASGSGQLPVVSLPNQPLSVSQLRPELFQRPRPPGPSVRLVSGPAGVGQPVVRTILIPGQPSKQVIMTPINVQPQQQQVRFIFYTYVVVLKGFFPHSYEIY